MYMHDITTQHDVADRTSYTIDMTYVLAGTTAKYRPRRFASYL